MGLGLKSSFSLSNNIFKELSVFFSNHHPICVKNSIVQNSIRKEYLNSQKSTITDI